jgi:hypothetical protein
LKTPGTLADVLQQVTRALSLEGDITPVQIGAQYRQQFGAGIGPKVLFVPEVGSNIGPPIEHGHAASYTHGCDVFVRAKESGEDIDRWVAAYKLLDRVIGQLAVACTGRIEYGAARDDSPLRVDGIGAGIGFSFRYRRDIRHDPARWRLRPTDTTTDDGSRDPPDGSGSLPVDATVIANVSP